MRLTRTVRKVHNQSILAILGITGFVIGVGSACIGESPEEKLRAEQGHAFDGNAEHRPGQQCLACHGTDYHPGGPVFVLAGTIYEKLTDPDTQGLAGARVNFQDSDNHEFTAITNSAGNFMVHVTLGIEGPQQRTRGWLDIPWQPVFPLTVAVIENGVDKSMESQIFRAGSCARCHYSDTPGVDHVEKVWHVERVP